MSAQPVLFAVPLGPVLPVGVVSHAHAYGCDRSCETPGARRPSGCGCQGPAHVLLRPTGEAREPLLT